MLSHGVIEHLDVVEHILPSLSAGFVCLPAGRLAKAETARQSRTDGVFSAFQTILGGGAQTPVPPKADMPPQSGDGLARVDPSGGVDPRLIQMMADPSLVPRTRSAMQFLLQQHLEANAPMDRLKALQIQKIQRDKKHRRNLTERRTRLAVCGISMTGLWYSLMLKFQPNLAIGCCHLNKSGRWGCLKDAISKGQKDAFRRLVVAAPM